MTEQRVSHFEIGEPLGHGGMGEVYRAVDRRLRRVVAVKFVAADRSPGSEADGRLLREARSAAALNHPNICTVYEAGQVQPGDSVLLANGNPAPVGTPFIAMELVTGTTLRDLAAGSGKLDTKEVVRLASQIASGLAEAHSKGIVHRDLKPENIVVTPDGVAKILDFGLAKPQPQADDPTASESMTTEFLTAGNVLMGTYPYMSPEQIERRPVDSRSDIFSFGIMLYELLAGRKPFQGETPEQTVAKILEQEPVSVSQVHPAVPPELARIVHRCLRKDPADRYNDTRDLVVALRDLERGQTGRRLPGWPLRAVLAGLLLAAVGLSIRFHPRLECGREPPPPPRSFRQITYTGNASAPDISPDGRYIAFLESQPGGTTRILVQDTGKGNEPLEIRRQPLSPRRLRWSPDGNWLLFYDRTELAAVAVHHLGGNPRTMAGAWYMAWAPDGNRYAMANADGDIVVADLTEGPLYNIKNKGPTVWTGGLEWSPRSDRLLLLSQDAKDRSTIWTVPPSPEGELREVLDDSRTLISPRWSPREDAIYYQVQEQHVTDLYKVRFDPETGAAAGEPVLVLGGLETLGGAFGTFSITGDARTLVYPRADVRSNLWLLTRRVAGSDTLIERTQLTFGTYQDSWPRLAPDGETVAFIRNGDIYTTRLDGGPVRQRTFLGGCGEPAWSPDGSMIAFGNQDQDSISVWKVDLRNPEKSSPVPLGTPAVNSAAMWREMDVPGTSFLTWEPRDVIIYSSPGSRSFQTFDPKTKHSSPLIREPIGWVFNPRSSPDGREVAFFWNKVDTTKLCVLDTETGTQHPISQSALQPIRWSGDGRVVYSFDPLHKRIVGTTVDGREVFGMRIPFDRIAGLTMSADGNRVVCSVLDIRQDVWAVENFDPDVPSAPR